jgi:diaminopimelate decarboxylase
VLLEKHGDSRRFVVLDAAMNDLLRPSLYEAWHDIVRIGDDDGRECDPCDVVGPVCETGDTFASGRELPRCEPGDLVAILAAGAYGASMGSTYNSRLLPAEVMVDGGRYAVVRRRQSFDEMIAGECFAGDWKSA